MPPPDTTEGTLLGGRVAYRQPARGNRTGLEPVLLAAASPARTGDRVLEGGTGAGAGLLCLAVRVPGIEPVGIEGDPATASLARANLDANAGSCRCANGRIVEALLPSVPPGLGTFAHAFANPPWHDPRGTRPPDAARALARQRDGDTFGAWSAALARLVRPGGTLSLIVPAALHAEASGALASAGCGDLRLFPLWPRAGQAARLAILRGRRASRSPGRILAGLVLHRDDGRLTPEAERVLRDVEALDLG